MSHKENKQGRCSNTMREQFNTLDREMEIAEYAKVGISRVHRRQTPRKEMGERTKKRKRLEKQDFQELQEEVENPRYRTRGSKAAMEEKLVQESFVFHGKNDEMNSNEEDDSDGETDDNLSLNAMEEEEDVIESADDEEDSDDDEYIGDNAIFALDAETSKVQQDRVTETKSATDVAKSSESRAEIASDRTSTNSVTKSASSGRRRRRKLYRMKNFKSYKLAQRHGEALGAHARGLPRLAIEKLERVAEDAPLAPQVYTSLGMVYQDMLYREEQKEDNTSFSYGQDISPSWKERLELAKKAYASYHTAAVLCKKDYMVWVRSGDTAREVGKLYDEAMLSCRKGKQETIEDFRALKLHWVQEAQKDFQAADNLKKAGIDIPAKLAATHMELGNLSEALAILTDLKKQPNQTYRTWMLYADLMLKIGFECTQWNNGDQLNENYMFRRWLRKYSRVFDWQERRLQALVLALEAAAGSDSCQRLVEWAVSRVQNQLEESNDNQTEIVNGRIWGMDSYEREPRLTNSDLNSTLSSTEMSDQGFKIGQTKSMLEEAKQNLIAQNKAELVAFDKECESKNTDLDESLKKQQEKRRANLEENQRKRLFDLVASSLSSSRDTVGLKAKNSVHSVSTRLPVAASCSTVSSIASELVKHCLGLEQFEGGRLVAESVSNYLRKRADMCEKRVETIAVLDRQMRSTSNDALLRGECYDEISDDSASDNEGPFRSLSDDEKFEQTTDLLSHFKKGTLPPEIQVLYALCLIGEGGKDFVASKLIISLDNLQDDTNQNAIRKVVDTDIKSNPGWFIYRCAMTDELTRIPALAFVSDFLRKINREDEWASKLIPIFKAAVESMEASGLIRESLSEVSLTTPNEALVRTQVTKIVLAEARLRTMHCKCIEKNCKNVDFTISDVNEKMILCFDHVMTIFSRIWKTEDGIPSKSSVEALEIMSSASRLLDLSKLDPLKHLERLQKLVHILMGSNHDLKHTESENSIDTLLFKNLPICSSWQNEGHKSLSRFAHNLCAACNVSLFSGWEKDEFNLSLLRRTGKSNYFGITIYNKSRVVGYLDREICDELTKIWSLLGEKFNLKVNFLSFVDEACTFLEKEGVIPPENDTVVTKYAEKEALSILVQYAKQCFVVSGGNLSSVNRNHFKTGLSLLLPMTQFCVIKKCWETEIGVATSTAVNTDEWLMAKVHQSQLFKTSYKPPSRIKKRQLGLKTSMKEHVWFKPDVESLPNYVPISVGHLNAAWATDCQQSLPLKPSEKEMALQLAIDEKLSALRTRPSQNSAQKMSLPVTLALIDLIPHAQNPFMVMQHAAMFASQCAKGGQMDLNFKTELPGRADCTPMKALQVLTRAECLAAAHFAQEAMFLCCHVVRICKSRRQEKSADAWTPQWEVVGICTYNTAINVRHAIFHSFLSKDEILKSLEAWKDDLLRELDTCRLDAIRMYNPSIIEKESDDRDYAQKEWNGPIHEPSERVEFVEFAEHQSIHHDNVQEEYSSINLSCKVAEEPENDDELAESINDVVPV